MIRKGMLILTLLILASDSAWSDNTTPPILNTTAIQYNFSNPGARSLGLGGAFVGLADDATAAYANPAGLVNLTRLEFSVEGRGFKYTQTFADTGHAFGPPTNQGIDTVNGIVDGRASDHASGISFLSVVYPHDNWSLAFYRHELANFKSDYKVQGAFFDARNDGAQSDSIYRFLSSEYVANLQIVNYGGSCAYRISDHFSAGLGLNYYKFSISTKDIYFDSGFFDRTDFSSAPVVAIYPSEGNDAKLGATLGILWKITDNWNFGAVYHQGATFEIKNFSQNSTEEFRFPKVFAFGTAFHPTDPITLTADLNHVNYSETSSASSRIRANDVNELHFGMEYVVLKYQHPIDLRLGSWFDPNHQAYYRGLPDETGEQREFAVLYPQGKDYWHYSGGVGLVLEKFRLDAAVDLSDITKILSLSLVYRFNP